MSQNSLGCMKDRSAPLWRRIIGAGAILGITAFALGSSYGSARGRVEAKVGVSRVQESDEEIAVYPILSRENAIVSVGEASLAGGEAKIQLPATFTTCANSKALNIQLTCKSSWSPLFVSQSDGESFTVKTTALGNASQTFSWQVSSPGQPGIQWPQMVAHRIPSK